MTNLQKAAAYAAYKELERVLNENGDLPPGFQADLSGTTVCVTIPNGTSISRDKGEKGDGIVHKTATQNLYGYGVWLKFLGRLAKFNQANAVLNILLEAMQDVIRFGGNVKDELQTFDDPDLKDFQKRVEQLKAQFPKREEQTPRKVKRANAKAMPALNIAVPKRIAA